MLCSLLDVLADRKGKSGLSGDVLVNGRTRPKNFKCVCGYVVQVCHALAGLLQRIPVCMLHLPLSG